MQHKMTETGSHRRPLSISKPLQLAGVMLPGVVILYGAGFMNTAAVHNAAHGVRYSQGFSCH